MSNTKEKIQEMIQKEKAQKRKAELEERYKKKTKKGKKGKTGKVKKDPVPVDSESKKRLRNIFFIVLFVICSLGLFYIASLLKTEVENQYQVQIKAAAKKEVDNLKEQVESTMSNKIENFNYILKDVEYIKNFKNPEWQSVLKTELAALLGYQAVIEIIPDNYTEEKIIDTEDMGYAVLGLLNELKNSKRQQDNVLKIEEHRAKTKNARLVMVRKVAYQDLDLKRNVTIGYIYASLSPVFVKELIKDFKYSTGYVELIQRFSGTSTTLARKGDAALKQLPLFVASSIKNTQWQLKLWPAAQTSELGIAQLWLPLLTLVLGTIFLVTAIILLIILLGKTQKSRKQAQEDSASSTDPFRKIKVQDIADSGSGITVDESDGVDIEYMTKVLNRIFRAYDIRGEYGEYINSEVFRQIALGIAREMNELKQERIAVARDGRNSSPELHRVMVDTLVASGLQVLDIGMVTSPVLYFAALTKTDGNGLMVTASHNPANYNGLKVMLNGHCYSQVRLEKLKQRILSPEQGGSTPAEEHNAVGRVEQLNIMEEYITKITANVILARPMNIVIDTGNGVAGQFAETIFQQMGCQVTALNAPVDGNFPVHEPDPSRPENLAELIDKVLEIKADIGFAFDGDGDRIGLVSSGGDIIWPDRILMLLAKDVLSRNKDATILYDVKSSNKLDKFIRDLGGNPQMCQSGHSFMKSKLIETGALLAGEMSGHIFIKERWYGFDDGIFVAARILEILSIDLRKSRQVFAELPDALNTPEILVPTHDASAIMEKLDASSGHFSGGNIITIDGIRVEYSDGWGLVRGSNTSDNLTLRFEAENEAALQRIASSFKEAILEAEPGLEFPF